MRNRQINRQIDRYKMNIHWTKCLHFRENIMDTKFNFYSYCFDCGYEKYETISNEEVSDITKLFII